MEWEKVSTPLLAAVIEQEGLHFHSVLGFTAMLDATAFVEDKRGRVLWLNPKAQKEWGVTHEQAIGKTLAAILGKRDLDLAINRNVAQVLRYMAANVSAHLNEDPHLFLLMFPILDPDGDTLIAGFAVKTTT